MRQGVDTVKPDVHVHRFVEAALGRGLSDTDAVMVLTEAARRLGRSATRLDWAIWEAGRLGAVRSAVPVAGAAGDSAISSPRRSSSVGGDRAGGVAFVDDDAGYLSWLGIHPDGFVLNCERRPTIRYLVAHRASCRSINPTFAAAPTGRTWTVVYQKVCANDIDTLTNWSIAVAGMPHACGQCKPPSRET
jgi:hypothetical protein